MTDTELASDLIVQAARLMRAVRRELELPAGMRVLSLLDEHGPLGITRLADLDRSAQPSMSGAVADLVERGWVTKAPNPDDARATVVALTDVGRAELDRIRRRYGEHIATLVRDDPSLTTEDLRTAVAVLRALLQKGSS
ncbi:MarR family winged helix-turn-helix transcriptional regulator [Nocardioides sp.]|uniref:MarR family winged helix-turn-helix transcriptional regulator n=1 Tax=Nocardioides sp. TaxID=35761 RepID=UPI0039C9024D